MKTEHLAMYRPIAAGLLMKYEDNEAVAAAHELMDGIMRWHGKDGDGASAGRACRPMLDRLLVCGATPRTALIELAALCFFWAEETGFPSPAETEMHLAQRLLLHVPRTGNRKNRWRRQVIAALGNRLRTDVMPLFPQMWAHYKQAENRHVALTKQLRTFAP